MLKKNDEIKLDIVRYGSNGEGIGVADGMTVFVPYTIAGERAKAHVIFAKKNFAVAKATALANKSPERCKPICPQFTKCGGCTLSHMNYSAQLEIKKADVVQTFSKVAGLDLANLEVIGSPNEYGYRNKLAVPFSLNRAGETICGFYQSGTHNIVEMVNCPLQTDKGNVAFKIIAEYVKEYKIQGYLALPNGKQIGLLRHAVIRAVNEGVIVTLVINGNKLPHIDKLYAKLQKACGVVSLYYNINKQATNVIFGCEFVHKCGEKLLKAEKSGIKFDIGAESFLQVNDDVVDLLYGEAVKYADPSDKDVVVNCYSGAGFLSGMLAKSAKEVVGIEIVSEASTLADNLAKENGLDKIMNNITGDVEIEFPKVVKQAEKSGKNVIFMLDPPRKGVDFTTLKLIKKQKPKKIVYISCNPQTLSRDVGILVGSLDWSEELNQNTAAQNGNANSGNLLKKVENFKPQYKITKNKCFDMFPQTAHVESVVLLELCE
ncbi:MAG: 23S rRNA (uracil(1939)-C(5))-methyltransferase RlmD [Bacillota bacterium]